jgi:hypothetical protein
VDVRPGELVQVGEFMGVPVVFGPVRMESREEGDKIICTFTEQILVGSKR